MPQYICFVSGLAVFKLSSSRGMRHYNINWTANPNGGMRCAFPPYWLIVTKINKPEANIAR
jgi:hypothetical protein